MFLQIDDSLLLEEIQDRFSECFPFLRLKFYSKGHKRFQATDETYALDRKRKVVDVRKLHNNGAMEIKSWYTVALVEKELKEAYGLNAQIFRCTTKGKWVQT